MQCVIYIIHCTFWIEVLIKVLCPSKASDHTDSKDNCYEYTCILHTVISQVDVIVNSTSKELQLKDGVVSASILHAAGQTIQVSPGEQYNLN